MPAITWLPGSSLRASNPLTVFSTELDALANGAAVTSGVIDNRDEGDQFMDLELVWTANAVPTADRLVEVYLVRSIDGTNFEDGSATRPPANGYVGAFVTDAVATQQREFLGPISLPRHDFKLLLVNSTGQAFSASGHTLRALFYRQGTA